MNEYNKPAQVHDDKYWIQYASNRLEEARNSRSSRYDKQWMINMAFYKGWQNLKYDKTTGSFTWDTSSTFFINLTYSAIRAVKGTLTKFSPVWTVDALPYSVMPAEQERLLGNIMTSLYEELDMKRKGKEVILAGMLCSLGAVQYGWDKNENGGLGGPWVEVIDPFDFYIDPVATTIENARYIVKVVRKPIEEVKENPNYKNTDKLHSDSKYSSSEYKERLMSKTNGSAVGGKEADTILVQETWCKIPTGDGKYSIHVITTAGGNLLREEETEWEEFPFAVYQPDVNINEIYGEGWAKNMVPLNRAINELQSKTKNFHEIFATGKYLKYGNSGVKSVTNENGQIISVDAKGRFEQMPMQSMSNSVFTQLGNLQGYFQDVSGAQDALMGRAPTGVTAAVAFEQLVANNMNTIADLVDNYEIFLAELGEAVLDMVYKYQDTSRTFRIRSQNEAEDVSVIGQGQELEGAVTLPPKYKVRVSIMSGVGFTKQARQETMMNLLKAGIVDQKTVLETLGLNADEIMNRMTEQKFRSMQEQQQMNAVLNPPMPPMPPEGEMPPQEAMMPQGAPIE